MSVHCRSVYDKLDDLRIGGKPFDSAYFSGSLMIMPDPVGALRVAASQIGPDCRIYITQTFQNARSPYLERVKPLLRLITTIDFGQVTYHN